MEYEIFRKMMETVALEMQKSGVKEATLSLNIEEGSFVGVSVNQKLFNLNIDLDMKELSFKLKEMGEHTSERKIINIEEAGIFIEYFVNENLLGIRISSLSEERRIDLSATAIRKMKTMMAYYDRGNSQEPEKTKNGRIVEMAITNFHDTVFLPEITKG